MTWNDCRGVAKVVSLVGTLICSVMTLVIYGGVLFGIMLEIQK